MAQEPPKEAPKPKTEDPCDDPEYVAWAYAQEGLEPPENIRATDTPPTVWRGYQFTPERRILAMASCEKWLGTPHVNRIAVEGVGIDCIHLIHEIMKDSGLLPEADLGRYDLMAGTYEPSDYLKEVFMTACCADEYPIDAPKFGDIVIFKTGKVSAHCGFYTPGEVWHSLSGRAVIRSSWSHWKHEAQCLVRLMYPGFKHQPKKALKLCQAKIWASGESSSEQ
jgi:hypothetical protein